MSKEETSPHVQVGDAWANDRRLQAILDSATAVVYVKDPEGRYLFVNAQFEKLFHVMRADILGRSDHEFFPADFADAFYTNDRRVLESNRSIEFEEIVPQDDGIHTYISIKFPIWDEHGRVEATCGISTDISERRRAEGHLRYLTQRLVAIREEERQRLGFDLHDDVCQELLGIGIMVDAARVRLGAAAPPELRRASEQLAHVGEHLRELARELRPMLLYDLGLGGGLIALAQGLSTPELVVEAVVPSDLPRLRDDFEIGLYRIAQEAFTNAVRHAQAHRIELEIGVEEKRVHLRVSDDGCGFDPAAKSTTGLGITSMEQRALALNGELQVHSTPDAGTTLRLVCPLRVRSEQQTE